MARFAGCSGQLHQGKLAKMQNESKLLIRFTVQLPFILQLGLLPH